jgi:4-hydroxy-tetrahydrodipicolinate synthase
VCTSKRFLQLLHTYFKKLIITLSDETKSMIGQRLLTTGWKEKCKEKSLLFLRANLSTVKNKKVPNFHGVYPIMATPFDVSERLDLKSFEKSIRFMKEAGCDGVTVVGVLGESNRLLDSERDELVRVAVSAAEGMPVIVGTSHPGTRATAELSARAESLGASGVMVTPSKEPTPMTEDRLVEYFSAVNDSIEIPIVLQDHPASTQVHMSVPTLARLIREVPKIECVKLESLPSPPRIAMLKQMMERDGRSVSILTGLGALYGAFDLMQDTQGFMTGFAFPEVLKSMTKDAERKDYDKMYTTYQKWLPMMVYEQQPGLAVRKEIYRLRGLVDVGQVRHPGANITETAAVGLKDVLERTLGSRVDLSKPLTDV